MICTGEQVSRAYIIIKLQKLDTFIIFFIHKKHLSRTSTCFIHEMQFSFFTRSALNGWLEESTDLVFRFVIGRTSDRSKMSSLKEEVTEYDDFLLLDIDGQFSKLPYKILAFFKAVYALYEFEFYVKADDLFTTRSPFLAPG